MKGCRQKISGIREICGIKIKEALKKNANTMNVPVRGVEILMYN